MKPQAIIKCLLVAFCVSCSTDKTTTEIETPPFIEKLIDHQEPVILSSEKDLNDFLSKTYTNSGFEITAPQKGTVKPLYISGTLKPEILTLYDYTSMKDDGNFKIIIREKLAQKIGIISGVYVASRETYYKTFTKGKSITPILIEVDQSKCGLIPSSTYEECARGYSLAQSGNDIKLTTLILHIKYSLSGTPFDIYYPLGRKFNMHKIEWNIPYIQLP